MTLRKPVQSRCWRSYVADASVHRNLLLSSVRAASASKCLLLARCRLLVKKGERVADCVHRYQSAMLKMRGGAGLAWLGDLR